MENANHAHMKKLENQETEISWWFVYALNKTPLHAGHGGDGMGSSDNGCQYFTLFLFFFLIFKTKSSEKLL